MKMNANTDRDALLHALTNANTEALNDQMINQIIEAEMSKPIELIDNELLDACFQLSERRHSPFTKRELSKSKRKGLRQSGLRPIRLLLQKEHNKANMGLCVHFWLECNDTSILV